MYYPAHLTNFSTIVYFHGGGLQDCEKAFPDALRNQNVAVVAPNYRLSSACAKCPDYWEDAAAAVAWVLRNIGNYGGNPAKVYISGGSAGGYLAAMIGMAPAYLAKHGISTRQLAGIMPIILCSGVWSPLKNVKTYVGRAKTINDMQRDICSKYAVQFVSVEKYAMDESYSETGGSSGTRWHPNDKVMKAYADELFQLFEKTYATHQ